MLPALLEKACPLILPKLQSPTCGTCGLVLPRPFICLHCSYGGCWRSEHILDHMKDLKHQFCELWLPCAIL